MAIRFSRWDGQWFYSVLVALTSLLMLWRSLQMASLCLFLTSRDVDNADINQRLLEVIEQIGKLFKNRFVQQLKTV